MQNVNWQAGLLSNGDGFANGIEHLQALVAHMRGINAAVLRRDLGHGD